MVTVTMEGCHDRWDKDPPPRLSPPSNTTTIPPIPHASYPTMATHADMGLNDSKVSFGP